MADRKTALILGGGAPNATLMAGALSAFLEEGVHFDIISTSGAGALIGLLYLAPKGITAKEALEFTKNYGVHDLIYAFFPVNYKVFQKSWPFDEPRDAVQEWLKYNPFYSANPTNSAQRLFSDWILFAINALMPTDTNFWSKGLCENVPFIEDVIDFDRLPHVEPEFYINAYNINARKMENFSKHQITANHFRAALALPFIYPPVELNGNFYFEGAAHDALNYKNLLNEDGDETRKRTDIGTIVVFDVLGNENLIRVPNNLWDAYIISIITPLVELARDDTKIFKAEHLHKYPGLKLLEVGFYDDLKERAEEVFAHALEWSYHNLSQLFDLGYAAGKKFCNDHRADLVFE